MFAVGTKSTDFASACGREAAGQSSGRAGAKDAGVWRPRPIAGALPSPPPRASRSMLRTLKKTASARRGRIRVLRGEGPPGVGYAVGRSVGTAVVRNRVRRRLRAAASDALAGAMPQDGLQAESRPQVLRIHATYLVVAMTGIEEQTYASLVRDLRECFEDLDERPSS